jgi:hypothetical protein
VSISVTDPSANAYHFGDYYSSFSYWYKL